MDRKKQQALERLEKADQEVMQNIAGERATHARLKSIAEYRALLDLESGLSDRQKEFLAEYIQSGIISRACIRVGLAPYSHRRWVAESPAYAQAFEDARQMADEKLELLAYDLASGVYSKPIVDRGEIVTYEAIYDTKLLQTLMKARMPEKYAQRVDVTSNGHSIVKLVDKDAWDSV